MMKNIFSIKKILIVFLLLFSLLGLLKPITAQAAEGSGWLGNAIGDVDAIAVGQANGLNSGNSDQ